MPIGQLSRILEGPTGYHILRVTERQNASRTPFQEAQKEIREKIRQDRIKKQYREFIERVRKQFPIWTIFDDSVKKAKPAEPDEPSRY